MRRTFVYAVAAALLLSLIGLFVLNGLVLSLLPSSPLRICAFLESRLGSALYMRESITFQGSGFASSIGSPWGWQQFVMAPGSTASLLVIHHSDGIYSSNYSSNFFAKSSLELYGVNSSVRDPFGVALNSTGIGARSSVDLVDSHTMVETFTLYAAVDAPHETYLTHISSTSTCAGLPLLTIGEKAYTGAIGQGGRAVFSLPQTIAILLQPLTSFFFTSESGFSWVPVASVFFAPLIWFLDFLWKGLQVTRGKKIE